MGVESDERHRGLFLSSYCRIKATPREVEATCTFGLVFTGRPRSKDVGVTLLGFKLFVNETRITCNPRTSIVHATLSTEL